MFIVIVQFNRSNNSTSNNTTTKNNNTNNNNDTNATTTTTTNNNNNNNNSNHNKLITNMQLLYTHPARRRPLPVLQLGRDQRQGRGCLMDIYTSIV